MALLLCGLVPGVFAASQFYQQVSVTSTNSTIAFLFPATAVTFRNLSNSANTIYLSTVSGTATTAEFPLAPGACLSVGGTIPQVGLIAAPGQTATVDVFAVNQGTAVNLDGCGVVHTVAGLPGAAPCLHTATNAKGIAGAPITVDDTVGGVTVMDDSTSRCGFVLINKVGAGTILCASDVTPTNTVGIILPGGAAWESPLGGFAPVAAMKCRRDAGGVSGTLYVTEYVP